MKKDDDSVAVAERPRVAGIVTGTFIGFAPSGEPLVDVGGQDAARGLHAGTCVALRSADVGKTVVLVFDSADRLHPIVLGLVQAPPYEQPPEVEVDGQRIILTGEHTVVLRCGEASIVLSRDGKVVIRGQHVVTHAAGINRIRGGSVQLN